jgi:hypothetical protein
MQKVVGSNPISRFQKAPHLRGFHSSRAALTWLPPGVYRLIGFSTAQDGGDLLNR